MTSCRLRLVGIVVVLLCTGVAVSAVATAGETPDTGSNTVEISEEVSSPTGEQTIVVRLTDRSPLAVQSTDASDQPSAMRAHASDTQSELLAFADNNPHIEIDTRLWIVNAAVLTVDTDAVPIDKITAIDNVEQIHENYELHTAGVAAVESGSIESGSISASSQLDLAAPLESTTTETTPTRAITRIGVPEVWDTYDTRGEGIRVAVVDTGVNPNHPDIDIAEENWVCYIDCAENPAGPHDVDGHGTHVSGTIIGGDANDAGLHIGVAPEATLMHAKGMDDNGEGTFESITQSMQWAIDNDADMLSMSLGTSGTNDALIEPVRNAHHSGVPVIAAVGNQGVGTSGSPANVYESVAVGSVEVEPAFPDGGSFGLTDNAVAETSGGETISTTDDWSNPPTEWPESYIVPDVTAPGVVVWSADTNLNTETCSGISTKDLTCKGGTSMATPHVAGTVALMQSATDDQLSPDELSTALTETAWKPSSEQSSQDDRYGYGIVNATAAVESVAAPQFILNDLGAPHTVTQGEEYTITVTVTNEGNTGTHDVDYVLKNSSGADVITIQKEKKITSGGQEQTVFEIDDQQTSNLSGNYTHVVSTMSSEVSQDVEFVEQPNPTGNVSINNQTTTGETITVSTATYSETDFAVGILPADSDEPAGVSDRFDNGQSVTNITVNLSDPIETNQTVTARLYETTSDSAFSDAIEINGKIIQDQAMVTVRGTAMHPSGVSQEQFDAVDANDNGAISLRELRAAVDSWSSDQQINHVSINLGDIRNLVNWWSNNL